jgi:acetyl-CoA carboxylase biotin carboxyl carrier protein
LITPEELKRLVTLVEENGLTELRYEEGDLKVTLRTGEYIRSQAVVTAPSAPVALVTAERSDDDTATVELPTIDEAPTNLVRIEAPIMGVFYRTPSPDDPPFVEVGDIVTKGQVVGLIEAMKTFNNIESEFSGRVVEIAAANRALVQPGDALILIDPSGEEDVDA